MNISSPGSALFPKKLSNIENQNSKSKPYSTLLNSVQTSQELIVLDLNIWARQAAVSMSDQCPLLHAKARKSQHCNYPRNYRPGFQNGHLPFQARDGYLQPQVDRRLPPPNTYPQHPILLFSGDCTMHSILLLPPSSDIFSKLLCHAKIVRGATARISPKEIVEHAMTRSKILRHISNGPSGRIWLLEKGQEEVLACLLLEMEDGWELLGIGTDKSQGELFLRQSYGFGCERRVENGAMKPFEWTRTRAEAEGADHEIPARSQFKKRKSTGGIHNPKRLDWTFLRGITVLNKWKFPRARMCDVSR